MKRKPKVEAWAAVFSDTGSQCEQDSVFFEKESAAYVAKLYDARPTRVAHLVEADPRRDAVAKTAVGFIETTRAVGIDSPLGLRKLRDLIEAVEKMRGGR